MEHRNPNRKGRFGATGTVVNKTQKGNQRAIVTCN